MDSSFTEHVLERARARQKKLFPLRETKLGDENVSEQTRGSPSKPKMMKQNSKTKISSDVTNNDQTLNIVKDSLNLEIKVSSTDNVRVEVEIDSDSDNIENVATPIIREQAKSRLQRLGKLYSGEEDLSSPIHQNEAKFHVDSESGTSNVVRSKKGLGRLAELANDINQWEDDMSKKDISEKKPTPKKWKPPAPQPPVSNVSSRNNSPAKVTTRSKQPAPQPPNTSKSTNMECEASKPEIKSGIKKLQWDPTVIESLESQGFTRTTSNTRLVYNFKNSQDKDSTTDKSKETARIDTIAEDNEPAVSEKPKVGKKEFVPLSLQKEEQKLTPRVIGTSKVASRAAMFEQKVSSVPANVKEKDPALLSVSERMKLFEKKRGEALIPKAPFGMNIVNKGNTVDDKNIDKKVIETKTCMKQVVEKDEPVSKSIAEKIAQLTNKNVNTISQQQIENKVKEERENEMAVLLNRFHENKKVNNEEIEVDSEEDEEEYNETTAMIASKSPKIISVENVSRRSGEKRSQGDSPRVQAVLGDVKRIKVTQPKDGKLYPCLSDIENATETEPEPTISPSPKNSFVEDSFSFSEGEVGTSFEREIMHSVCKKTPERRVSNFTDTDSDVSNILDDMDDYLNEVDADTDSIGPTPPKNIKISSPKIHSEPSQSFKYKNFSPRKSPNRFQSPCKIITSPPSRRTSGDLPTHVVDGEDVLPLRYTVSFYRKQQTQKSTTPVRHITREIVEEDEIPEGPNEEVADKIKELTEEMNKQQMVISQTSCALNLCNATPEFTGSTEQVEAEKLLLLATHRRQVASMEIQRLQVEDSLRPLASHAEHVPLERGVLIIKNISIPLKKEYVRALSAAGGKGHHVVCLVKCGEQVAATKIVSTVASSPKNLDLELNVPDVIKFDNIYSDFTVCFEIYCLQAQEEVLPHEVKYHINKKGSNKMTPKKMKDSRLVRPPKESPAGPQAIRTSTFALNGYVVFSINAINKLSWTLNKIPSISPLEGTVIMKVSCKMDVSVEHRGFLNMFEDISGLGAWHRRWCLLKGETISYWKYPEDERKKAPIDSIDLKSCTTTNVGQVSREICARLNTFLLERERPAMNGDRETLTMTPEGDRTIIKHLLSADTKDERLEWCRNLNKALSAIRIWGYKKV
ncbi:PREDICTED: actin-binding protein anillin-like isoform X2 [Nicrophorus vespilloides]|uniref:Actin-binding protein anillin-like isoform X2 n=1 Tax=Nicrophorus vespilloides TaxID=110193 RepID=A0ABM1MYM2_NICVS|nr:PREDICTED: actin-binding protein anillin-like isoform X2 [Nicrophorus vespilloides]